MPQKNKVAKKRLDKFYYLAKERGYRSRAAFKLLQLDKKYEFLAKSTGVLDLCAAPGSWMQVARQHMPSTSPCIGIDLAPIKPVPKCVALQGDIKSAECRAAIKRELKDKKVDVVLHDGAPNVGTAWLQDAFGQNELTLHSLRLATEFMVPGATFVTKAFRSADYNALLFVFNQLFKRVEATKPQASRNESAEIFVVCSGFTAAKIDPRFLDPKHVFKDLDVDDAPQANVLQAKKGAKAPAHGYDTSSQLLTRSLPVREFVLGSTPVKQLGEYNSFVWDGTAECAFWREMKVTTPAIVDACKDLKLLSKNDFRRLLQWRLKASAAWEKAKKEGGSEGDSDESDGEDGEQEEDAEARLDSEINELERMHAQREKASKRKEADRRRKVKERLSLQMEHPGDRLDISEDMELFSLARIKSGSQLQSVGTDAAPDETADVEEDGYAAMAAETPDEEMDYMDRLDAELNAMHADDLARTKRRAVAEIVASQEAKPMSKKARRAAISAAVEVEEEDEDERARRIAAQRFRGLDEDDLRAGVDDDDDSGSDDDMDGGRRDGSERKGAQGRGNGLLVNIEKGSDAHAGGFGSSAANNWFSQDIFGQMAAEDEDDEAEVAAMAEAARRKRSKQSASKSTTTSSDDTAQAVGETVSAPQTEVGSKTPTKKKRKQQEMSAESATVSSSVGRHGATQASLGDTKGGRGAHKAAAAADGTRNKAVREKDVLDDDDAWLDDGKGAKYDSGDEEDAEKASTHWESQKAATDRQAEAVVLGQMLLNPQKRRALEDLAYNRHTFNDPTLPQWFLDDERKFAFTSGYGVDLDDGMLDKAKNSMKGIASHSIGKVAEAKMRKQRRLQRALTKMKKKADALAAKSDLSEREKAREIEKLYKKKLTPKKEKKTLIVGKRFQAGSSGKMGHNIKLVDKRLRSDTRAQKNAVKHGGKRPKGKGARQHKAKQYNRKKR